MNKSRTQKNVDHCADNNCPFSGQLINGHAASKWLTSMIDESPNRVSLCSAFLRSEALSSLYSGKQVITNGRILSRWRLSDLLSQASDLNSYIFAKRLGFAFFIRQDFHGKVFAVSDKGIIVGSANSTLSGFGLKEISNSEVCTLVPDSETNNSFIDELFHGAVEMTDKLFEEISNFVGEVSVSGNDQLEWPDNLIQKLCPPEFSGKILLSECFSAVPVVIGKNSFEIQDEKDIRLLGLTQSEVGAHELRGAFKSTRIFRWLCHILRVSECYVYFGSLSDSLHSTLLDDPVVYRREVKNILQTLLDWCQLLEINEILIDRPNHSQRIRIT